MKMKAEFDYLGEGIAKGDEIGVVVAELDLTGITAALSLKGALGKTAHSYLIAKDRKLRSNWTVANESYTVDYFFSQLDRTINSIRGRQEEKQQDEQREGQGAARQPLQGQMSMDNALRILDALKESEKEFHDYLEILLSGSSFFIIRGPGRTTRRPSCPCFFRRSSKIACRS